MVTHALSSVSLIPRRTSSSLSVVLNEQLDIN